MKMRLHTAALALVWYLLLPQPLRAAGGAIAVPGTADVLGGASEPKSLERQVIEAEEAKAPPFKDLTEMSGRDANGAMVQPVSTSVHIENGSPVWYVGTLGKCGRGELPPPDLEVKVRAEFAKYTTTPVKFEKGQFWVNSGSGKNPVDNCK
jgi:hypothetical protein